MRLLLALLVLLLATPASGQNLTANRLQLLPAVPGACPAGKVCVVGTTATTPYRVAFQDASGNIVTMGDAWRLRQCAGPCVGALNGDMWFDTGTGIAYIKQAGSNLPIGVGSSPVQWNVLNGTSISANGYWGPTGDTSATATLVSPFVAPCAGTIVGMRVQGNANATGNTTVTLQRSAGGATISYAATLITCTISSGDKSCADTSNTFSVTGGDLFLLRITSSNWSPSGGSASIRVACNAT